MDENKNNGNVVMLVVIAIITMIIVVVGATFAYLASNVEPEDSAGVQATTSGSSDLLLFNIDKNLLELNVTERELCKGDECGDVSVYTNANVVYQTNTVGNSQKFDISIDVGEDANDFGYTSGVCLDKNDLEVADEGLDNQDSCEAIEGNHWQADTSVAELVLDVYEGVPAESCETGKGKCIDKSSDRLLTSGEDTPITNEQDCSGVEGSRWVPDVFEAGVCYSVIATRDVTDANGGTVVVVADKEISAAGEEKVVQYYRVAVGMRNLPHNQVLNANKHFAGTLNFRISTPEDEPESGE